MKCALKIEDLGMSELDANRIIQSFKNFAREIGYSEDRISDLECRSRDGFYSYSHNKGGIECVAFRDQYMTQLQGTGFKNADKTLDLYESYDVDLFINEYKYPKDPNKWTDTQRETFDASRNEDSEATIMFGFDLMYMGKEGSKHQANLRFTVCVKDAPYHRQYDDLISIDIEWDFHNKLDQILNGILQRTDVKLFSSNVEEAY